MSLDGDVVVHPTIPPRRVWDLFSNRVVPFSVLSVEFPDVMPSNVWAVSHSWVAPDEDEARVGSFVFLLLAGGGKLAGPIQNRLVPGHCLAQAKGVGHLAGSAAVAGGFWGIGGRGDRAKQGQQGGGWGGKAGRLGRSFHIFLQALQDLLAPPSGL